jgi:solute:Na+ symporter, SSS family
MNLSFTFLDWSILASYLIILTAAAIWSSRTESKTTKDYFLAGNAMPVWLIAISVLSTTQSAATFLGGPDFGFRGDYTYVTSFLGALVAALIVSWVLLPRFYAIGATTVYELLEVRFGAAAKRAAGIFYLIGRVFAAGARLYMAAIAVAMVVFLRVDAGTITMASFMLLVLGIVFTFVGGLKSVVWSDLVQVVIYVGAAIFTLFFLLSLIPASPSQIADALAHPPSGPSKLNFVNTNLGLDQPFSLLAIFTGLVLLNIGNSGLDQDTTQRLLACENVGEARRSLIISVLVAIPVVTLFVTIGQLLYIFYERPDIMTRGGDVAKEFEGQKITVFMSFILSEMPPGLRGLVTVGVIAAAAINSGLNAMASVIIEDFYRPWREKTKALPEKHFVQAGQVAMVVSGLVLFAMSVVCYYWQTATDMPLLEFALSVMAFAYAGLLGVYFTAILTKRGNVASVIAALVIGFVSIFCLQPYVLKALGLAEIVGTIAFPFQLCIGTLAATLVCCTGSAKRKPGSITEFKLPLDRAS